jgi:hypothetical protein
MRHTLHELWPSESWYLPTSQFTQDDVPTVLYVPALQSEQDAEESEAEILPAGHAEQELEPAKLNFPAKHTPQEPVAINANSPDAQLMQVSMPPLPSDILPAAHELHAAVLPSLYLPTAQEMHSVLPLLRADMVPAAQMEQEGLEAAAEKVPAPHARQALDPTVEDSPAAHWVHAELPLDSAILPASHGVHEDALVPEIVPGEHDVHVLLPEMELYLPASQS